MFVFYVGSRSVFVKTSDVLVSNSVNAYPVNFQFSAEWETLEKHAVFKAGTQTIDLIIGEDCQCQIPWEVLQKAKIDLYFGAYGVSTDDEKTVILRTSMCNIGTIQEGAMEGNEGQDATPTFYQQLLSKFEEMKTKIAELDTEIQKVYRDMGSLTLLETEAKTDLVSAINSLVRMDNGDDNTEDDTETNPDTDSGDGVETPDNGDNAIDTPETPSDNGEQVTPTEPETDSEATEGNE